MCTVSVDAAGTGGNRVRIPETSTLTFGCASDRAAFTLYVKSPAEGFGLGRRCLRPRLLAAWPTVMGLPPGETEVAAVRVRNV
jgi:hypothetical protein